MSFHCNLHLLYTEPQKEPLTESLIFNFTLALGKSNKRSRTRLNLHICHLWRTDGCVDYLRGTGRVTLWVSCWSGVSLATPGGPFKVGLAARRPPVNIDLRVTNGRRSNCLIETQHFSPTGRMTQPREIYLPPLTLRAVCTPPHPVPDPSPPFKPHCPHH